jgi:Tat protein secretion system quality control protein TatD with DNase activity
MGSRARNAPEHVARIGAMLAGVRGLSVETFAEATTTNVRRVLNA